MELHDTCDISLRTICTSGSDQTESTCTYGFLAIVIRFKGAEGRMEELDASKIILKVFDWKFFGVFFFTQFCYWCLLLCFFVNCVINETL